MFLFKKPTLLAFSFLLALNACGGGDGGSDGGGSETNNTKTAYLVDSGVRGMSYSSASYSGITDSNGGFNFAPGEVTTFSFHGLQFGSVTTANDSSIITPLDLFNTTDVNDQRVINTLVFLQSLDNDQNPANGISLPESLSTIAGLDGLDLSSPDFQSGLLALNIPVVSSLLSEMDALNHFNETLLTVNANTILDGRWISRDAKFGDVNGVYTFSANQTLTVTEFNDCGSNYWAATEDSAKRNCTETSFTMDWVLDGQTLSMSNSNISDNCTIITSTSNLIEANCVFQGSGPGTELTRFERDIPQLSNSLVNSSYREVTAGGSTSFTTLSFDNDLTGSYVYHNESGVAQSAAGDLGDYIWSTAASQLSIAGTDNNAESFSATYTLQNQIRGTLSMSVLDTDGAGFSALIPDFNANLANDLIDQVVFGVYDAVTGACKQIYMFDATNIVMPLRKEASVGATADVCDFASPVTVPQTGDANVYSVSIVNGAFLIERANEQEICWPIAHSTLSSSSGFAVVACSTDSSSAFNLEIWRGL